jgi:hypothetical protein
MWHPQTTTQPSRQDRVTVTTSKCRAGLFDGDIVHIALLPDLDGYCSIGDDDVICLERNAARSRYNLAGADVKSTLMKGAFDDAVFDLALT